MSQQERDMLESFNVQAKDLLASKDRFIKNGHRVKVGLESELAIHAMLSNSELVQKRDAIIADNSDFTDVELGASQIEIRTPPIDLISNGGIASLKEIYEKRFASVLDSARRHEVGILRIGANPFLPTIGVPRTDKIKYHLVPDFYNQHRSFRLDTMIGLGKNRIDIGDASVVSLFQSFQVNLEADSLEDACDKMNRSLAIAPYLLAFSGNARYLNCQDTKIQDVRMMSWEISHYVKTFCDTGNWNNELRIGLPRRYFRNIVDYLQRAGTFPFILYAPESALAISIGMTWLDARVKFIGDSAIVELRLPSTQPTTEEETMLMLLYIGRLRYSQVNKEQILPINMVRENRLSAMLYGLKRPMWFLDKNEIPVKLPTKVGLARELEMAMIGLNGLGLLSALNTDLLNFMFEAGSPSDRLAKLLNSVGDISVCDMEHALLETKMLVT